jgi:hypothetical protein
MEAVRKKRRLVRQNEDAAPHSGECAYTTRYAAFFLYALVF